MENLKVYVEDEVESEEVQKLLFDLNCYWYSEWDVDKNNIAEPSSPYPRYIHTNEFGRMYYCAEHSSGSLKTKQQLRDLVVLKRNSVEDATHYYGVSKYYLTDSEFYQYSEGKWVNIDEYVHGMTFKKIETEGEVKMEEYLGLQEDGSYKLVMRGNECSATDIKVPEGADIFLLDESCGEDVFYFVKHDGEVFHEYYISGTDLPNNTWMKGTIKELHKGMGKVLWQRNHTTTTPNNTLIQDKLKFIEKWLNGEKIQYILGIESEKTQSDKSQWHNFTEGAMQYIKRPDIKFHEAPKYVTINGIEFKNVEKLLKYVKNNFDLEDGE